jgi:hypothetical protein
MTDPEDDTELWRNRFILMNLVRLGSILIVLPAILLWQTDRFGIQSIAGFPIALAGFLLFFLGPRYLARKWRPPPGP